MKKAIPTLSSLDLDGKIALVRVDFNVPLDGDVVVDDTRIRAALPTIQALRERCSKVVLCSHLGRPKGKVVHKYSLLPAAAQLARYLETEVLFAHDTIGSEVQDLIRGAEDGSVIVLENLRFFPGEKGNDMGFAKSLAALGDVFINDAFGAMHRKHASITSVPKLLPSAVGLLVERELKALSSLTKASVATPFSAVLGGAKVSDKLSVIDRLSQKVDHLFIGGGMAYTFLKAEGIETGKSMVEDDQLNFAARMLEEATGRGCKIHLPSDHVVADTFDANATATIAADIPADQMALDIGPETVANWSKILGVSRTIFWNGPLGVFEWPSFANGTESIAKALANSSGFTIIGGGDSAAAAAKFGVADKISFISTGGGASLEFLREGDLVGLDAIRRHA